MYFYLMGNTLHTLRLNIDWKLRHINQIERFEASFTSIEKKEGQSLKHFKKLQLLEVLSTNNNSV